MHNLQLHGVPVILQEVWRRKRGNVTSYLEVKVNDVTTVHVLNRQQQLSDVERDVTFGECILMQEAL